MNGAAIVPVRVVLFAVPAYPHLVLGELSGSGPFVLLQILRVEVQAVDLPHGVHLILSAGPAEESEGQCLPGGVDEELLLHPLAKRQSL